MRATIIFLLLFPLLSFAQNETRLALVIGNSNYDAGKLDNPVNDALLIAETLEKLDFDVILDTNISNQQAFKQTIFRFGEKRPNYNVAFVYYAGHGIQVGSQNYLLPTQQSFRSENEVRSFGVNVQEIMMYLNEMTDQINVLILDACRNNPFEGNWAQKNRSLNGDGSGLAEMEAPSGSLIAFSTVAGTTAPDGYGTQENSLYTICLSEEMSREGIDIYQVFNNVRRRVKEESDSRQQTEESNQLTNETPFYLVRSNYEKEFSQIDSLIVGAIDDEEKKDNLLSEAMRLSSTILATNPRNRRALLAQGDIYLKQEEYNKAIKVYNQAIKWYPNDPKCLHSKATVYYMKEEYEKALSNFNQCIDVDSMYSDGYFGLARTYMKKGDYENAIENFSKKITLNPSAENYEYRAECYVEMGENNKAILDYSRAIDVATDDDEKALQYNNRARLYANQGSYDLALEDYAIVIEISTDDWQTARAFNDRANIYWEDEKWDLCIEEYTKAIDMGVGSDVQYSNRGRVYSFKKEYENAIKDFNEAIKIDPSAENYEYRANCYVEMEENNKALRDYSRAIDVATDDEKALYYNNRGDFYKDQGSYDLALEDYAIAIEISTSDWQTARASNGKANIYKREEKWDLCIEEYTKAIILIGKIEVLYRNRAGAYQNKEDYENAIKDFDQVIEINPSAGNYDDRADCYVEMGENNKALLDYSRAIDVATDDEKAVHYNNRGDFYKDQGSYDLALEDYAIAIEISTDDWQTARAINGKANIYTREEKWDLCIEEYTKAIILIGKIEVLYRNRAVAYQKKEDYENAIKDFDQVIEINPSAGNYDYRADCYVEMGENNKALLDYSRAIDVATDDEKAFHYNNRGQFHKEQGSYDLALEDYAIVIEISTDDWQTARAINNRANIYWEDEKWDLCIEEYTKAIDVEEGSDIYYNNRGRVYSFKKEYENAIKDFNEAIKIDPSAGNYDYRADCYVEMGENNKALLDYSMAIDVATDDKKALHYNNRGQFHKEQGSYDLALEDYAIVIEISTDDWQTARAINGIANIYWKDEKWDLCIEEYTKAIDMGLGSYVYYNNRGRVYSFKKEYENAIKDFNEAIEINPSAENYEYRADCYVEMGENNKAFLDYSRAIDVATDDEKAFHYNNRGQFHKEQGSYDLALEDYAIAIEISTDDWQTARAINNRANIYWEDEKWDLCIEEYTKVIDMGLGDIEYSNRGRVYSFKKEYENAIKDFNEAIEINPSAENYEYRADCYVEMGENNKALLDYSMAIDVATDDEKALHYNNRGQFHKDQGAYELALVDLDSSLIYNDIYDSYSYYSYCYSQKGLCYVEMEKYENAKKEFSNSIQADTTNSTPYLYRAKMFQKMREYQKAKDDYLMAIQINNKNPVPYYYLALIYMDEEESLKAIKYFGKAIAKLSSGEDYYITAENGEDRIELADIYLKMAEIYKNEEDVESMCEEYKEACDLGKCEMFEKYCQ